jgi:hypothetical protein
MNPTAMRKTAHALAGAGLAVLVGVPPVAAEETARPAVPATPVVASPAATLPTTTKPALALEPEAAKPIQAVTQEFPDGKGVLAYYTPEAGRCDLVLMMVQELAPRIRVSLAPDQAALVEDVSGGSLEVTCGAGAERLLVERHPAPKDAVAAR